MSCDNTSPNTFCEYNKVLSIISTYINTHNVVYCIIGRDMNTDIICIKIVIIVYNSKNCNN